MERSVSDTRRRWAVEEASKHAGSKVFTQCLLPHCADDQLDCVQANLATRGGMWEAVGRVLQRGITHTQHRWAVEEACKHASDWRFATYIVPRCVDDQLDLALTHLMTRGLWWCIGGVLERGVSDTQRR